MLRYEWVSTESFLKNMATQTPTDKYKPAKKHLELGNEFYDVVKPADFPELTLRYRNQTAAKSVGLDGLSDQEWCSHFGEFTPLEANLPEPLALRYHGHQFRSYNPDLGDGRGFLFAQLYDDRDRLLDLGTKGSGQTPWSRAGDGRLTLKGGVREVLATELLTAHGVNTSKSFSLIETGERLYRNDEPSPARSSVLVRLSHSHIRIGTFQRLLFLEDHDAIEKLVHYAIDNYWPDAKKADNPIQAFYSSVVGAVAKMGAQWFIAGFVHGVLNTDNITITGESFDYGPWRFLPKLDPEFTAAYFDQTGLYAFGRQPDALHWNLARLAECLIPLYDKAELENRLNQYSEIFETELQKATLARLGIVAESDTNDPLLPLLFQTLRDTEVPFEQTLFDLTLGANSERLEASPSKDLYNNAPMGNLIAAIRDRQLIPQANDMLNSDIMAPGRNATTLLIEEVEQIWSGIAEDDNWELFDKKLSDIRAFGAMNARLAASN